jgi:hypothetical protein
MRFHSEWPSYSLIFLKWHKFSDFPKHLTQIDLGATYVTQGCNTSCSNALQGKGFEAVCQIALKPFRPPCEMSWGLQRTGVLKLS